MFLSLLKKFLVVFILATLPFKAYSAVATINDPTMAAFLAQMEKDYEKDKGNRSIAHSLVKIYSSLASKAYREKDINTATEYFKKNISVLKEVYEKSPEDASFETFMIAEIYGSLASLEQDLEAILSYLDEGTKYGKLAIEFGDYPLIQKMRNATNEEISYYLNILVARYCSYARNVSFEYQMKYHKPDNAKGTEYARCNIEYLKSSIDVAENKLSDKDIDLKSTYKQIAVSYAFLAKQKIGDIKESYEQSIKYFEKVMEMDKNDYFTSATLAVMYSSLGLIANGDDSYSKKEQEELYKKAVKYSKNALKTKDENEHHQIQSMVIDIYLENKEYKEALKILKEYAKNPRSKGKGVSNKWTYFIYQDTNEKRREEFMSLLNGL